MRTIFSNICPAYVVAYVMSWARHQSPISLMEAIDSRPRFYRLQLAPEGIHFSDLNANETNPGKLAGITSSNSKQAG